MADAKPDGYYWYSGVPGDPPDLESDEPQVVLVYDGRINCCGGDITYPISEVNGRFVGPLEPPARDDIHDLAHGFCPKCDNHSVPTGMAEFTGCLICGWTPPVEFTGRTT